MIYGNMIGGAGLAQTYILEDDDGNQIVGVLSDEPVVLDATANDIRTGKKAATDFGVTTGTKDIPSYYMHEGVRAVPSGSDFIIPISDYDYTKLQAIICPFNSSFDDSVSAEKVSINDNVYEVLSAEPLASVLKDESNARVDLGITNDSDISYIIRYFMFKEVD